MPLTQFTKQFSIKITHVPSNRTVEFDSFLTSFSDSFKPSFKTQNVYGRMDPIVNYQNTSRTITIAFVVPAASEQEAVDNLKKLSLLGMFQYPEYTNADRASGINSPPICKMKFQNLVTEDGKDLFGYFGGFDFSPVNEAGYFIDDSSYLYPKEYKVNLTFNVLHTKPIGWQNNKLVNGVGPYLYSGAIQTANAQQTGGSSAAPNVVNNIAAAAQASMDGSGNV